jgi:hypothetical protein
MCQADSKKQPKAVTVLLGLVIPLHEHSVSIQVALLEVANNHILLGSAGYVTSMHTVQHV